MPQSLVQLYAHVVFSTKTTQAYLQEHSLREKLHAYLTGACNNLKSPSLIMGGVEDHVHVLCRLSNTISMAELVREIKRESPKWCFLDQPFARGRSQMVHRKPSGAPQDRDMSG